jgi:hypothetical protein
MSLGAYSLGWSSDQQQLPAAVVVRPGFKYYLKSIKYFEPLISNAWSVRWVVFSVYSLYYWSIKPGKLNQAYLTLFQNSI